MNRHLFRAPTMEGEKLNLTSEQEHLCKVVYKKSADAEGYVFHGLWNPEHDYPDDYAIFPLRSVFNRTYPYGANVAFANIIGSSFDPLDRSLYGSWRKMLEDKGISCDKCVTDGKWYDPKVLPLTKCFDGYICNDKIIGGHIVDGCFNKAPSKGSIVYLIPICTRHNVSCTDATGRTGSGFYMKTEKSGTAIELAGYLQNK